MGLKMDQPAKPQERREEFLEQRVFKAADYIDRLEALSLAAQNALEECARTAGGEEAAVRSHHHRHACALVGLFDDTVQQLRTELYGADGQP